MASNVEDAHAPGVDVYLLPVASSWVVWSALDAFPLGPVFFPTYQEAMTEVLDFVYAQLDYWLSTRSRLIRLSDGRD